MGRTKQATGTRNKAWADGVLRDTRRRNRGGAGLPKHLTPRKHKWTNQAKTWQITNRPAKPRLVVDMVRVNFAPAGARPEYRPVPVRVPDPREYRARVTED